MAGKTSWAVVYALQEWMNPQCPASRTASEHARIHGISISQFRRARRKAGEAPLPHPTKPILNPYGRSVGDL